MSRRSSTMRHQEITMVTSQSCQCKSVAEIDAVTAARAAEIRGCTVYYACSGLLLILVSLLTIIPNVPLQPAPHKYEIQFKIVETSGKLV
ncbi:hypothetical protein AC249_AIPGENE13230 [Exaiptasia diaphana]|nr:hypothetical protein AC249_AIPGENE13230 [Exaiptasia diaphana]